MKDFYSLILLFLSLNSVAQNLVPNSSFEDHTECPDFPGEIHHVIGWSSPSNGTSDYYHQCSDEDYGVPRNYNGWQHPKTGMAYIGIVLLNQPKLTDYREYIEVKLTDQLIPQRKYGFTMYVCLAENFSKYVTDDWGIYFSRRSLQTDTVAFWLNNAPQIQNPKGNFPDTSKWTLSSGSYVAEGGEQYLIIGNFKNDSTEWHLHDSTVKWEESYIFIDDVSLVPEITTEVQQNNLAAWHVSFDQGSGEINIQGKKDSTGEFTLFDIQGNELLHERIFGDGKISTENFSPGIYLYQLRLQGGEARYGKLFR